MSKPKRHVMDTGEWPDMHYVEVSQRLVDQLRQPYVEMRRLKREMLRECGEVLRWRVFRNFVREPEPDAD